MGHSEDRSPSEKTLSSGHSTADSGAGASPRELSFLPGETLSEEDLRRALADGPEKEKRRLMGHLVSYAPWDEIWTFVDADELRAALPELDLPDSLRSAWERYLED